MPLASVKSEPLDHSHGVGEVCPWCEQPIPEDQSAEIQARIKQHEGQEKAKQEAMLRTEFANQQAQAEKRFESEKTAAAAKAREEEAKENTEIVEQVKREGAKREAAIRIESAKTAEAESAQKIEAAKQKAKDASRAAADLEEKLKTAEESKEAEIGKRLSEANEAYENSKTAAVNAERSKNFNDKLKLEEQLKKLQRQVEQKSNDELGEGAEIDLLDLLKGEFKGDLVQHVGKGKAGVDIIHDIVLNGNICGRIVYDCKNRGSWLNSYVSKLRSDQIAAKAEYAILSSNVFPKNAKQLHEQDGVIVACPARVVELIRILRRAIVQMHKLGLSNQERDEKTAELYDFIRSDECKRHFERFDEHTDALLELQVKEKKQHEAVWQKQGTFVREIQKTSGNLNSAIDRIIGAAD